MRQTDYMHFFLSRTARCIVSAGSKHQVPLAWMPLLINTANEQQTKQDNMDAPHQAKRPRAAQRHSRRKANKSKGSTVQKSHTPTGQPQLAAQPAPAISHNASGVPLKPPEVIALDRRQQGLARSELVPGTSSRVTCIQCYWQWRSLLP